MTRSKFKQLVKRASRKFSPFRLNDVFYIVKKNNLLIFENNISLFIVSVKEIFGDIPITFHNEKMIYFPINYNHFLEVFNEKEHDIKEIAIINETISFYYIDGSIKSFKKREIQKNKFDIIGGAIISYCNIYSKDNLKNYSCDKMSFKLGDDMAVILSYFENPVVYRNMQNQINPFIFFESISESEPYDIKNIYCLYMGKSFDSIEEVKNNKKLFDCYDMLKNTFENDVKHLE